MLPDFIYCNRAIRIDVISRKMFGYCKLPNCTQKKELQNYGELVNLKPLIQIFLKRWILICWEFVYVRAPMALITQAIHWFQTNNWKIMNFCPNCLHFSINNIFYAKALIDSPFLSSVLSWLVFFLVWLLSGTSLLWCPRSASLEESCIPELLCRHRLR